MPYDFSTWDDLAVRRQFWYLTQRMEYYRTRDSLAESRLQVEREAVTVEAIRRGIGTMYCPFPKEGCSDLIG